MLLQLVGVDSIDAAETWRAARVQIRRSDAVTLPEGSFYSVDLIGYDVVTSQGRTLGPLDEVLKYPGQDLLRIGATLIPAVRQMVVEVDTQNRRIVVDPPEGLLPDEEPKSAN